MYKISAVSCYMVFIVAEGSMKNFLMVLKISLERLLSATVQLGSPSRMASY